MRLFSWLFDWFSNDSDGFNPHSWMNDALSNSHDVSWVNPATGLPMIGGMGGVDVAGNPFGTDLHDSFNTSNTSNFDDSFSSNNFSSWDNS